jgi:hypothetical protein
MLKNEFLLNRNRFDKDEGAKEGQPATNQLLPLETVYKCL